MLLQTMEFAQPVPPGFWSVTMYDGKTQLLIKNPIDRYLINSPMLESLKKNADGSVTFYIQNKSPGADKESNWLPAPAEGNFVLTLRAYLPKSALIEGRYAPPMVLPA